MIKNVAALLTALQQKEIETIERSCITHAPTIGDQYEGLTSSILDMMIPSELELQVVSGFVQGIDGSLSGQIDCMLVKGSGTPIPQALGRYKWPIKDVLAVFEVKKTLFGSDLADAHDQLQSVMALFWPYAATITPADDINIDAPRYVYQQILGEPAPVGKQFTSLPVDRVALYRMLIDDHVAPVRIILGYGGYKTEETLREGFLRFIGNNPLKPGFAGSSLPSLIVSGENSIIKTNGQPYYFKPWKDRYLCYASSAHNPILWILNLVLTRISHHFNGPDWYSRDLSIDRFHPLLWGKAVTGATMEGWEYLEHPAMLDEPEEATVLSSEEWHPVPVSEDQALLLALVGNDGIARKDLVAAMMEASELPEDATLDLVRDLNEKRLVAWDDQTLVFLTRRCTTAFTPKDGLLAHDMEDARFVEWMMRDERWRRPPMR